MDSTFRVCSGSGPKTLGDEEEWECLAMEPERRDIVY